MEIDMKTLMKRVVDGVAYNTATSTRLAEKEWNEQDERGRTANVEATLYQTQKGAFFVHKWTFTEWWDEEAGEPTSRSRDECIPMTAEEASAWLLRGDVNIIHNPFGEVPEAAAEPEQGATIYLRVPGTLKQRVDRAANAEGVSSNAWALHCVEQCLGRANLPKWLLKDPELRDEDGHQRVALSIAEGWPVALLPRAHAAHLGRQLIKVSGAK